MKDRVFIIAEAGVNHNGSLEMARRLVEEAARAGADAVKFQTFRADSLVSPMAPKADYQKQTTAAQESQYDMLKRLELSHQDHLELMACCRQTGIQFLSSPFDLASIDLLVELGLEIFKVPSGEITNLPYLRKIGGLGRSVILSTGMAELGEIDAALAVLIGQGMLKESITLLHCNTEYPTPMEDVNLRAMLTMREVFSVKVGYSDHTQGLEVPVAAVALGARVIEKHFTLDRKLAGPDHGASLEPDELRSMVRAIRNIESALGDGIKQPSPSERKNLVAVRKSIFSAQNIRTGDLFTEEALTVKRPAEGLSPMLWDQVIGKRAPRNYSVGEAIVLDSSLERK
jgi:N,N'-diacetyllegionaminate synthase